MGYAETRRFEPQDAKAAEKVNARELRLARHEAFLLTLSASKGPWRLCALPGFLLLLYGSA